MCAAEFPSARIFRFTLLLLLFSLFPNDRPISGQTTEADPALRAQAVQLFREGKFDDALPLFEKLNSQKPGDSAILEGYSYCTLEHAATLTDPEARKALRIKARKLALEAQAAGNKSSLVKVVLEVPEDGSQPAFSARTEVDDLMHAGEAAYAKGDYDAALQSYRKALELDAREYEAALFIGDVYFKKGNHQDAGSFFLRANQIDPNRETAYRYWGDDLMAQNRASDAKTKFVQAVVAEPYQRKAWMGLIQWAGKQNVTLAHPSINPPGKVEDKGKDAQGKGQINITIDPSTLGGKSDEDGSGVWFVHSLSKAPMARRALPEGISQRKAVPTHDG